MVPILRDMRSHLRLVPFALASLILASLASAGCGGAEGPPGLEEYFTAVPYQNGACNVVDQRLAGEREVHLFVHGDVDLLPITQGLASYYHRHGLSFVTLAQPAETPMSYALDTDINGLMKATLAAFPDVDFDDEEALEADPVLWQQIQAFIANYYFRPMIDFATAHAAGQNVTNLVLIPDVERPGGDSILDPGKSLAGLSVSPALLAAFARMMDPENQAWQAVNLPSGFTPMVVLGANVLASVEDVAPVLKDLVTSHEFGHSAGLIHSDTKRNLMYPTATPGLSDCTDSLTDEQLDMMRTTLNLGTAASAPATAPQSLARFRAAFRPAHVRALFAGDQQAMRSFVELLRD